MMITKARQKTLADLKPGESGVVTKLNSTGASRRRLMDLGILPGTLISAEFASPAGDPVAYQVRGSLIALRAIQAHEIEIDAEQAHPAEE